MSGAMSSYSEAEVQIGGYCIARKGYLHARPISA